MEHVVREVLEVFVELVFILTHKVGFKVLNSTNLILIEYVWVQVLILLLIWLHVSDEIHDELDRISVKLF